MEYTQLTMLAHAIILQAADDYRKCLKNPNKPGSNWEKLSIEHFFLSQWYAILSGTDNGEKIIYMLKQSMEQKKKPRRGGLK